MTLLERFQAAAPHIKITGNILFCEEVDTGDIEKTLTDEKGNKVSLIITSGSSKQLTAMSEDKPLFIRILDVGQGYYNSEKGEDEPSFIKGGMICLVPAMSVRWLSTWGDILTSNEQKIGYTRDTEVIAWFTNVEEFQKYKAALRS